MGRYSVLSNIDLRSSTWRGAISRFKASRHAALCFGAAGTCVGISAGACKSEARTLRSRLVSQVPLGAYIRGRYDSSLGLFTIRSRHEFISTRSDVGQAPTIDFWDLKRGRLTQRVTPPEPISNRSIRVSHSRNFLVATQDIVTGTKHNLFDPHRIFVWNLRTRKLVRTIDLGRHVHLSELVFLPAREDAILVSFRYANESSDVRRLARISLRSGRFWSNTRHRLGKYLLGEYSEVVYSPDGRLMASVTTQGEGEPGVIDVVEVASGRWLCRFRGDHLERPVVGAVMFLPGRRVLFGSSPYGDDPEAQVDENWVFDVPRRASRRSRLQVATRRVQGGRFVAGFPGRAGCGFFEGARGLEMRDIARRRVLKRWPHLKHIEQIVFAPDARTVGIYAWREAEPQGYDGQLLAIDNGVARKPGSEFAQFWRLR